MIDLLEIERQTEALKKRLGSRVCVVGHHYQKDEIIHFCDYVGDTFELMKKAAAQEAECIIFCGVSFMAETAALLAREDQTVLLPGDLTSARVTNMPAAAQLKSVLSELRARGLDFLPLAYVNTTLDIKAVTGKNGGALCTSSNLRPMLRWAFRRSSHVLLLPDRNLALNVARQEGIDDDQMLVIDVDENGLKNPDSQPLNRHLLIWPGCCSIHEAYTPSMINEMRYKHPCCRVIVHSEARPEVVALADAAGSTSFLVEDARETVRSGRNPLLVIGTELNLVNRLRAKYRNKGTIVPLLDDPSQCDDTAIVTPKALLSALQSVEQGTAQGISIAPEDRRHASVAVLRMLDTCGA